MASPVKKRVTLKDIARAVGLSERAVSQALSRNDASTSKVSATTRNRVQRQAELMGYRHDRIAQSLRTGRTGLIGILTPQPLGQLPSERHWYVTKLFQTLGRTALTYQVDYHEEAYRAAADAMLDAKVDGTLLVATSHDHSQPLADRLLAQGVYVSSIGLPYMNDIPRYVANKEDAFFELTKQLVQEGYRDLVFMGRSFDRTWSHRNHDWHIRSLHGGFERAARWAAEAGYGVEFGRYYFDGAISGVSADDIHPFHAAGYLAMKNLLRDRPLPELVMCPADVWALGALRACAEEGVHVPEQLALTGFENDPVSSAGSVPLTTVAQPHETLARLAVGRLLDMIEGKVEQTSLISHSACRIIMRRSTQRSMANEPSGG